MDIYNLKIFLSASQTLNFTKTAQEFYMVQPVISRRIRELEAEFGCQLFVRERHGVSLTEEGKLLVPAVQEAVDALNKGLEAVKERIRSRTGEISIAAITPATNSFLPAIIGEFSLQHPDMKIDVQRSVPKQLMESIVLGSHDIYLSSEDDLISCVGWESLWLRSDPIGLILRKNEAVSTAEEALQFLSKSKVFMIPADDSPSLSAKGRAILNELHLTHLEVEEVRPIESLMFNIASGLGVSILPDNVINLDAFNLKFVPLNTNMRVQMKMVWRPDAPSHVKEFAKFVKARL